MMGFILLPRRVVGAGGGGVDVVAEVVVAVALAVVRVPVRSSLAKASTSIAPDNGVNVSADSVVSLIAG